MVRRGGEKEARDTINCAQHMFAKEIVAARFGSVYKSSGGCIFTLSSYLLLVLETANSMAQSCQREHLYSIRSWQISRLSWQHNRFAFQAEQELVPRALQSRPFNPAVHFGLIASREDRDDITNRDGVIAFEMEGAGVWETRTTVPELLSLIWLPACLRT
jgi:hypothetical protein